MEIPKSFRYGNGTSIFFALQKQDGEIGQRILIIRMLFLLYFFRYLLNSAAFIDSYPCIVIFHIQIIKDQGKSYEEM